MTTAGRVTGVFVMFAGVGIIGALASILPGTLVPESDSDDEPRTQTPHGRTVQQELEQVRLELSAIREMILVDRRPAGSLTWENDDSPPAARRRGHPDL